MFGNSCLWPLHEESTPLTWLSPTGVWFTRSYPYAIIFSLQGVTSCIPAPHSLSPRTILTAGSSQTVARLLLSHVRSQGMQLCDTPLSTLIDSGRSNGDCTCALTPCKCMWELTLREQEGKCRKGEAERRGLQSRTDKTTVDFNSMSFDRKFTSELSLERYWWELLSHTCITYQLLHAAKLQAIWDGFWPFLGGSEKWSTLTCSIFCMRDRRQVSIVCMDRVLKYNLPHITLLVISS
jgi:hypothetical protein